MNKGIVASGVDFTPLNIQVGSPKTSEIETQGKRVEVVFAVDAFSRSMLGFWITAEGVPKEERGE